MSRYEELKAVIGDIATQAEKDACNLALYAESVGTFNAVFSSLADGSNDSSAKSVYCLFITAQKDLYKAVKALIEASKTGKDWCGEASPKLILKKVRH